MQTLMGYKLQYGFWEDLTKVEHFTALESKPSNIQKNILTEVKKYYETALTFIEDTGNVEAWEQVKMLTELSLVLNWKCWEWYDGGRISLSEGYSKLFYKNQNYFYKKYAKNEEALQYYFEITD